MENGFCLAEDSDLFGPDAFTEPRLQPLGQTGEFVCDRTEWSHSGYRTVNDGDSIAGQRVTVGVGLRRSEK